MAATDTRNEPSSPVKYDDKNATRIINTMGAMSGERESWETLWQDCSDYILPRKSSINTVEPQGEQRTIRIHDTTAIRANEKFAAGLYGYLTPPDQQWFSLEAENPMLQRIPEVRDWFADASEKLMRRLVNSNFQQEIHESYLQLGAFCTSMLYLEEGLGGEFVFKDIPCGKYWIAEDSNGQVNKMYRKFVYTARQAVERWGINNPRLPSDIKDAARDEHGTNVEKDFTFIHAIEPRSEFNMYKKDNLNMPYASSWISEDFTTTVEEGGYNEKPFMCCRYLKSNVEIYGRGPGTSHLPDVKQINFMEKTVIKQVEKLVDPPILVPDDGANTYRFRSAPNTINYWKATNPANKPEPFQLNNTGALSFGEEKLEQKRQTIREAWHNDFFQAITNIERQMTATEILERVEEKIVLFAPTMGRLQTEKYTPMLQRAFNIMFRQGNNFQPLPQVLLQDPRFKVNYQGKISKALKMVENKATLTTLQQVMPMAELKPEILDIYNFDEIARTLGMNNGMPISHFNDEKMVAQMRQQRQLQAMAMAQAELENTQSQTLNNVAQMKSAA